MTDFAITSIGKTCLLVKNNKIIGKGFSVGKRDGRVSIKLTEGSILEAAASFLATKELTLQYAYLHFSDISGYNIDTVEWVGEDGYAFLEDVYAVDEFNFSWGMVPEMFKTVPGYRSALVFDDQI